ncbi:MAG: preprotein translocase subunit SecE [Patescibacteria group bacterium]|nr:preprotein translocase subunit SecE [Patescibacteria group bacterium]
MFKSIGGFFRGVREQITEIVWPKKELVLHNGIVVIIAVIIAILLIAGIDYGFSKLISWYIALK